MGILVINGGREYCIPISSPKKKHKNIKNSVDLIKIFDLKVNLNKQLHFGWGVYE